MGGVLVLLAKWLGGSFIKAALDAYKAKLEAAGNRMAIQERLAERWLALEAKEAELKTQLRITSLGRWYTVENLFGYVLCFYFAKVLIWDAALHLGTTDLVKGPVGEWAGLVVVFFFGKRTLDSLILLLRNLK